MGSSSLDAAKLKQIEDALVGTGYKLLKCFESSDEILIHLKVAKEVAATGDDKVSKHEFANKENDSGPSEAKEKERGSNTVKKTIRKEVSGDKEKRKNGEADLEKKIDSEDEESDVELLSTFMKIIKSKAKRKCCSAPKKIKTAPSVDKGNEIDSSADSEKQNESLLHKTRDEVISLKNGPNDVTNKENDCGLPSKLQKISTSKKTVKEKARIEKGKRIDNGADSEENNGSLNQQFCRRSQKHEGKSSEDKLKGRRSDAAKNKGEKGIALSGSTSQKRKGIHIHDDDSAERLERKETGNVIIPKKINLENVADKIKVSPKESKNPSNLEEKNNSRRSGADYDGQGLVNMRIKVLRPKHKKFYAGTIDSFDPLYKMHMVNYDNGVIEILDLRDEIWKPLNERPQQAQEANLASPSSNVKEQVKTEEKGSKRKPDSTSKQLAPSSPKRSKTKN